MNAEFLNLRQRQIRAFEKMKKHRATIQLAAAFGYPHGLLNQKYRKWSNTYNNLSRQIASKLGVNVNRVKFIDNYNRRNWRNFL